MLLAETLRIGVGALSNIYCEDSEIFILKPRLQDSKRCKRRSNAFRIPTAKSAIISLLSYAQVKLSL